MSGSPQELLVVPVLSVMVAGCHLVDKENVALRCVKQPLYHEAVGVSRSP